MLYATNKKKIAGCTVIQIEQWEKGEAHARTCRCRNRRNGTAPCQPTQTARVISFIYKQSRQIR
jgi:hypothetical protein